MNEDKINVGDRVDIFWEHADSEFKVEVLHVPCATGDCWHLKRPDGTIVYVNAFAKMIKRN